MQRQELETTELHDEVDQATQRLCKLQICSNKTHQPVRSLGLEEVSTNGTDEKLKRKLNGNPVSPTSHSPVSIQRSSSQTDIETTSGGQVIPLTVSSIEVVSEDQVAKRARVKNGGTHKTKSSRASTHRLRKFRSMVKLGDVAGVTQMLDAVCREEDVATCHKFVNTKVEGEVALHVAIENNDVLVVQQLVRFGATPTVYLENIKNYPIFTAAERPGCFDVLQQLIVHSHNDLHFCDQKGFRALERALLVHRNKPTCGFKDNTKTIVFLINQTEPAKLLKVCLDRNTTLHIAADSHDSILFSRLLSSPNVGDFIDCQDVKGDTVSHRVCAAEDMDEGDQLLMLNYLRTSGAMAIPNNEGKLPHQLAQSQSVARAAQALSLPTTARSAINSISLSSLTTPYHSLSSPMSTNQNTAYKANVELRSNCTNRPQENKANGEQSLPDLYNEVDMSLACQDDVQLYTYMGDLTEEVTGQKYPVEKNLGQNLVTSLDYEFEVAIDFVEQQQQQQQHYTREAFKV